MTKALKQYQDISTEAGVGEIKGHRLVQMLMQGALDKMAIAKGYVERQEIEPKGIFISAAISIIDVLQASLDREAGGAMAENLYVLYQYMMRRLVEANLNNEPALVQEVIDLMITIKSGWDGIADTENKS